MGSRKDMAIRISVPRRILLLLHDNMRFADSFEVPDIITQSGIGRELDLRQTHVSRALSELDSEKLIESRSAHIKGAGRRRKAYFLSRKGIDDVEEHIEEITRRSIVIRSEDGQLKQRSVGKALLMLGRKMERRISPHELFTRFYNGSEVNLFNFEAEDGTDGTASSTPVNRRFFGREKEIKTITKALKDQGGHFLVIKSIAGGGKTALMGRISFKNSSRPMKWTVMNEWMGPENLLSEWGHFLNGHGRTELYDQMRRGMRVDMNESITRFLKGCRGISPILMIDDLHRGPESINRLLSIIRGRLRDEDDIKFIITTREKPTFYGRKDLLISDDITEIELEGLDRESAYALLGEKGIPTTEYENAMRITRGHPLALELYSETTSPESPIAITEFEEYLGEEVLKELSEPEFGVLKLASIFKRPVLARGFLFSKEISAEVLDRLCDKLILRKYRNGTYDVHDLIRSYFRGRMTDGERERYSRIACDHLAGRGTDQEIMDHILLLEGSGRREEFIQRILEEGEHLMSRGYGRVRTFIDHIDDGEVEGSDLVKLLLLRSDSAVLQGDLTRAKGYLGRGLDICDTLIGAKDGPGEIIRSVSRIFHRSAEISKAEGKMGKRIELYRKSVRYNREYDDKQGLGKALNNLALAQRDRGELDKALKTLKEALEIYGEADDRTSIGFIEANIAGIHFLKRDRRSGRKHLLKAQKARVRYPIVKGRLMMRIGDAWGTIGEYGRAEEIYLISLEAFREAGDAEGRLDVLLSLFDNRFKKGKKKEAREYLTAASRLNEARGNEHNEGKGDRVTVDISRKEVLYGARWDRKSLKGQIKIFLRSAFRNLDTGAALKEIEGLIPELARNEDRMIVLEQALDTLKKHGDPHPGIIVRIWKLELLREEGETKKADRLLREVRKDAKGIGFQKALDRLSDLK